MAISGLRDTSNFVADQRPKNWREAILLLYPNGSAPLTALTSLMGKQRTDDPEFNWWDKAFPARRVEAGADLGTGTSITLDSGGLQLKAGDLLKVEETDEIMRVTAVTNDTTITVTRSWGSVAATTIDYDGAGVNPNLLVIGSAYEENSDAPDGVNYDPTKRYNYTQIFRNTLEMSRTAQRTRLRTGDAVKEAKREVLEIHSTDMERAFIHGERVETTVNSKPARSTGGIMSFVDSTKDVTADSTTDLEQLEEYLLDVFEYGSDEKIAFTGNRAVMIINQIVRKNSSYQIFANEKEFGMKVMRLVTPYGELVMRRHPLFNQMTQGTNGGSAYYAQETSMLIVDQTNLKYRYIDDTMYEKVLQGNGIDGMKSGYLTEAGLEIHHPKTHYILRNLQAAAADA